MSMVKLSFDGKEVEAGKDMTVLQAARSAGVEIPSLCYHERLSPIGSCGLCVVEIEGYDEPVQACKTPVSEGMAVTTSSELLQGLRQDYMKQLLLHHPLDCPVCDKAGECRLQDLVFELGIKAEKLEPLKERPKTPYSTPLITYWRDRCVLCLRCVTACHEIKGVNALGVTETEDGRKLEFYPDRCVSCGECLQVCPVGALTENVSPRKGRAFLVKQVSTTCTYCGCGCQMNLDVVDNQVANVRGRKDAGGNQGSLCVKGRFGYEFIASDQRLTRPLIRKNGELQEADWDVAIRRVARNFAKIKKEHGPDALGGFSSARCTNEENYLFMKFMRAVIGTNNVDHCARL
jgi:predicted molibdopterin-dependent oxidoreductase YjgC